MFFQILIYQNLIISLLSPGMDYQPTYVMLEGTNFVVLCTIAMIALNRLRTPVPGGIRRAEWSGWCSSHWR